MLSCVVCLFDMCCCLWLYVGVDCCSLLSFVVCGLLLLFGARSLCSLSFGVHCCVLLSFFV